MKNNRLIALRGSRTQKQMARELQMPPSTFAMIECGRRFPRKDLAKKIADHFSVTVDFLFFQTDDQDEPGQPPSERTHNPKGGNES